MTHYVKSMKSGNGTVHNLNVGDMGRKRASAKINSVTASWADALEVVPTLLDQNISGFRCSGLMQYKQHIISSLLDHDKRK